MSVRDHFPLTLAELNRALLAVEPAAVLTPPRVLRRVIKHDRDMGFVGLQVPHRKTYVISRDALLSLASRADLGVPPQRELPPTVILISSPSDAALAAMPRGLDLVKYWRLLFHARVHCALHDRQLTAEAIRRRVHDIGPAEFDEIRTVLRQEKLLLPPHDDATTYEEFAAVYLELAFFDTTLLLRYFPAIDELGRIDRILAHDVDAAAIFEATRLPGAPDPIAPVDDPDQPEDGGLEAANESPRTASEFLFQSAMKKADRAARRGNVVRAAIERRRAAQMAASKRLANHARNRATAAIDALVERLRSALGLNSDAADHWRRGLAALLPRAARSIWPAEARLLYDLQKVCVDFERPVFSPDLVEWAYSGFRRRLIRPLPHQPLVLAVKHLRSALNRLTTIRIPAIDRRNLSVLLREAEHQAEQRLRQRLRPVIGQSLAAAGIEAQNVPERVGREKLVEELLDRVIERGFLNLGDLRDAISRNDVKLPDLASAAEFVRGPLLRANARLANDAAGIYRRGEFYLRWLQRLSAAAFATAVGRWITLFILLPFGGAYATIVFVQEMLHLMRLPHHLHSNALLATVVAVGVYYVLLIHVPVVRQWTIKILRSVWRLARAVVWDLPASVLRWPPIRRVLDSPPMRLVVRGVLKPLPAAALAWIALWGADVPQLGRIIGTAATLFIASAVLNSAVGRDLEEVTEDWVVRRWEYLRNFVPGLVRWIADFFKRILETVERGLYSVDEWLRFRSGQGRTVLVVKTAFGLVWFFIAYVIRLYVNVLIEPTVNPLKHFPAVTVAAKLLVPFWIPLTEFLATPLLFLGRPIAYTAAFLSLHALPGAAGFLVWELKENWRLYRANRSQVLRPAVIGHHGETVLRLLRLGFHSGTLPRLYTKLRRAERRAHRGGSWRPVRRWLADLHHVEARIAQFVERELIAFVKQSSLWPRPLELTQLEAGSNRIRVELACPALSDKPFEFRIEEQSGWLLASVDQPGWLAEASAEQAEVFIVALAGFYKRAGVHLTSEQIESMLGLPAIVFDITDDGLVVWLDSDFESAATYDLRERPVLHPHSAAKKIALPAIPADKLFFSDHPMLWRDWVRAWEQIHAGRVPQPLGPIRLLPASQESMMTTDAASRGKHHESPSA